MNSAMVMTHPPAEHPLLSRIALWSAWFLAAGIFLTLGWMALAPDDPLAPVSLLARSGAGAAWGQCLALACVAGVGATLIVGRRVPDIGVFSAAIGLAVVSFRGNTIETLLYRASDPTTWADRHLAVALAAEALSWAVLLGIVAGVSGLVARWCHGPSRVARGSLAHPAGADASRGSASPGHADAWLDVVPRADGLRHAGVVLLVGLVGFRVFSTGLYSRSIQHGQVCFLVAASAALGVYVAMRVFPVDSPRWGLVPAALLGVVGYLIAGVCGEPSATALPVSVPGSHFLRVLPIQSVAVGTIAAIATYWNMQATETPNDIATHTGSPGAPVAPPARGVR